MRSLFYAVLVGSLSKGGDALTMSSQKMDGHHCKVLCQRFGMKALGPKFASIHNPTECCQKCDEVYPSASLLQVAGAPKVVPATQVSPHPVKSQTVSQPLGNEAPVRR
mmetsp:Transcript_60090/g.95414  ORF Transcript_60090/g.95414 Transcript_60090/m.95414 type:complete len:108 (+) Transcript_60090:90-413(+)